MDTSACTAAQFMSAGTPGAYYHIPNTDNNKQIDYIFDLQKFSCNPLTEPVVRLTDVYPAGYSGPVIDSIDQRFKINVFKVDLQFSTQPDTGTVVQINGEMSTEYRMEEDVITETWFSLVFGCEQPSQISFEDFECTSYQFGQVITGTKFSKPTLLITPSLVNSACVQTTATIVEVTNNGGPTFENQVGQIPYLDSLVNSSEIKIPYAPSVVIGTYTFELTETDAYTGLIASKTFSIEVLANPPS